MSQLFIMTYYCNACGKEAIPEVKPYISWYQKLNPFYTKVRSRTRLFCELHGDLGVLIETNTVPFFKR